MARDYESARSANLAILEISREPEGHLGGVDEENSNGQDYEKHGK